MEGLIIIGILFVLSWGTATLVFPKTKNKLFSGINPTSFKVKKKKGWYYIQRHCSGKIPFVISRHKTANEAEKILRQFRTQ